MKSKDTSPFTITETLHEGGRTLLLRGIRTADRRPVILKALDPRRSRPRDIERLKHEHAIMSAIMRTLDLQTIVKPLALEIYEGLPALVMEDFGGEPLDRFLGAPMNVERFLDLASRTAAAVEDIHQRDIIHKDLKPQNILINAATGEVKLVDFGLASRLPRVHEASRSPSLIEGSLAYLSPEQTGRMNPSIDSRADLYALGVTFYEMLTGRLPFEARDPLEWVHCHVAGAPQAPSAFVPELPEVLSAIVLKLLAKMPEDRYQTARGLQHDLERCLAEWQAAGRIEPFPLAEHDISGRFQIPQKLYGREDEVAALLRAFERVVGTGSPALALVSGYSGIGKSALVHELHKPIVSERGFFISGKFDQYKRGIPYSTIAQAFRELVLEILAESEDRIALFRERLLGALGINGQLIVDMIPPVELVIGRQPPVPELPPTEARNRFRIVFRHFIGVFTRKEHPVALFLDDLQWADSASLGLLEDLMTHPETCQLLVIGAYRDHEVPPSHPLMPALDRVRRDGAYKFLHDRVQEAAYSLIPKELLAEMHLTIGRRFLSHLPREAIMDRVFDIANQLNRGALLITDLAQAAALLPEDPWSTRYEDTFALHLELSECEYLAGEFQLADELFTLILEHARSNPDRARVYRLRLRAYQMAGRHRDAVSVVLEAARLFGVTLPESGEEIQAATEAEIHAVPVNLRGRRIADLAFEPMATDADVRALIGLLAESMPLVYTARPEIWPLVTAMGLNFSLRCGNTEESSFVYSCYAITLVSIHGNLPWALQFSEMSLRLNKRIENAAVRGRLLLHHGALINVWCRHFATSLPIVEQAFVACLDAGDLVGAGYVTYNMVWLLVENGDPLDRVIEVSRRYAAFARQNHNDVVYNVVRVEEQFAASLKGATRASTSFSDGAFDEAICIAVLEKAGFGLGIAYYHIMKQIAAFIHERYAEALESAASAAPLVREVSAMANEGTHHFYLALTLAAIYPQASAEKQQELAQILEEQLQKHKLWADNCPENFLSRHALLSAEVARVEGRYLDAEHLYEQAIRSARENGFVHNEALAHEIASRFYRARGFDLFADTYLREARSCYARWGADGKVKQIDQRHPRLLEARSLAPTATFAVGVEQLDLLSVVKASQSISSELVLDDLNCTLLRVALEQGGAQKGFLILCWDDELSIEAEAVLNQKGVVTNILPPAPVESSPLVPVSLVHYVRLTKRRVILSDAAADADKFSADPYFARQRPRSVLCLPILKQSSVIGLLYLENNLLTGAFTPDRLVALSLLATQSAISMENAHLHAKERKARAAAEVAERRSAFLAEAGEILSESLDYEETLASLGRLCVRSLCDWCVIEVMEGGEIRRILPERSDEDVRVSSEGEEHERLVRALGTGAALVVPLVARGQTLGVLSLFSSAERRDHGAADLDLAQEVARRAAIAIDNARLYRNTQEAIRVRDEFLTVATHELNTPMTSLMLTLQSMDRSIRSGRSCDLQVMGKLVERALRQGTRLTRLNEDLLDVARIHAGRLPLDLAEADLGAVVSDVVEQFKLDLAQAGCTVSIREEGRVVGRWDSARVDQIVVNLLSNAIKFGAGKPIEILLGDEAGIARLAVRDHGIGIDPAGQGRIFDRFERAVSDRHYGGLGLGLYISRRIAEAHGGSIHVESELGAGATFTLELPCAGPLPSAIGRAA